MPELILCSASHSRLSLLQAQGWTPRVHAPSIDDAHLPLSGLSGSAFTLAMAWFKLAQALRDAPAAASGSILLAADTTCFIGGNNEGKPTDSADATRMVRAMCNTSHEVFTGVAAIVLPSGDRILFVDRAVVRLGSLGEAEVSAYAASGLWRGRAGAYNYSERLAAGWPLSCDGDPSTVVGLPMNRLQPWLLAHLSGASS